MEIYPRGTVMPGGVKYEELSMTTYDQMWEQWDTGTQCPGGIFWSRNRIAAKEEHRNLKSTISNAQHLMMGGRIYPITKDPAVLKNGIMLAEWLISIVENNLPEKVVPDGIYLQPGQARCGLDKTHSSYTTGMTAAALAIFGKATNNQKYIDYGSRIVRDSLDYYLHNNIITDVCEPIRNPEKKCQLNQVQPKGTYIRGLSFLFRNTNDNALKQRLKTVIQNSARAILPLCTDDYACNSENWAAGIPGTRKNLHAQINALELFNALLVVIDGDIAAAKPAAPTEGPGFNFQWNQYPIEFYVGLLIAFILLIVGSIFGYCYYRRYSARVADQRELAFADSWDTEKKFDKEKPGISIPAPVVT
jgi:hypothetical protein